MSTRFLRPALAAIGVALVVGALGGSSVASGASSRFDGATAQSLEDLTGSAPLMLKVRGVPAALAWANAKGNGASNAEAAHAAQEQRAQNENAQQGLLRALENRVPSAQVLYRVQKAFNGVAVLAPAEARGELATLPNVEDVSPIAIQTIDNASTVPMIGAPTGWQSFGKTGAGIKVGVIDTGIDYTHTNFGGPGTGQALTDARSAGNNVPTSDTTATATVMSGGTQIFPSAKVAGGFDFVGDAYNASSTNPANNTPNPDGNPEDCPSTLGGGHGSHVSGTAAGFGVNADGTTYGGPYDTSTPFSSLRIGPGVAPQATLYALRVFGCSGSTAVTTQAIDWATDPNNDDDFSDHLDVINMSLGAAFGTPDDSSAEASNNAALAGVQVVTSAGNSGDAYYDSGSPGSAARALSTASGADEVDVTDAFQVNAPPAIAGMYGASRSSSFNWVSPPVTSPLPLTADLYYPAVNQYGCSAFTGANADPNVSGKILLVDWKKPTDATFPCGSAARTNNAQAAGAKGVIMVDSTPYLDTAIAGNAGIPAMYSTSIVGNALKSQLTAGVPSSVSITLSAAFINQGKITSPGRADTLSTFSSRGVRGIDNALKPDITAEGQGVFSTDAGTGTQGKSLNGTSMASPHMAGVMALVAQTHPAWSIEERKALVMNTAGHDLFTQFNQSGDKYGPGRVGSGRVDVPAALGNEVVAYATGGGGAVGVSFGALEVVKSMTADRTVTVANKGGSAASYALSFDSRTSIPGVSFSFPDGTSVNVPAGGTATFRVRLTADPALMKHTHDPTVTETQTSNGPVFPRQWLAEASGLILLTPASGTTLRVPVYATARPASKMHASQTSVKFFGANATSNVITLAGAGVNTGASEPLDLFSRVTALELTKTSGQETLPTDYKTYARHADIHYVGVSTDAKAYSAADFANTELFFGIATWANWTTAATEATFQVEIDTNNDNTVDYRVFNTRLTNGANADPQDILVSARTKPATATTPAVTLLEDFTNILPDRSTALFNSNVMVVGVFASDLGLTAANSTFRYRVISSSRFFGPVDAVPSATGWLTYDAANPGLDFSGGAAGAPMYPDQPTLTIPANYNAATFNAAQSEGVLLLHHMNGGDDPKAEVLTLQTSPGKPPKSAG